MVYIKGCLSLITRLDSDIGESLVDIQLSKVIGSLEFGN